MLDSSHLIFLQIVSESFPVSSSGHIALALCIIAYYNKVYAAIIAAFFSSQIIMFLLHVPTIMVVALFFRDTWQPLLMNLFKRRRIIVKLIAYALVADCVTIMWYLIFLIRPITLPLFVGFTITALMLFSLRWCFVSPQVVHVSHMIMLGFFQGMALLPGISRFGTVYVVCRWFGIRATKSFGIAWMLQWPLMVAGAMVSGLHALLGKITIPWVPSIQDIPLIIGASMLSFAGLNFVYFCARTDHMWIISIYMLLPILIAILFGC